MKNIFSSIFRNAMSITLGLIGFYLVILLVGMVFEASWAMGRRRQTSTSATTETWQDSSGIRHDTTFFSTSK